MSAIEGTERELGRLSARVIELRVLLTEAEASQQRVFLALQYQRGQSAAQVPAGGPDDPTISTQ